MSNNTEWREVAPGQNQKEVTINEQLSILDSALTEVYDVTGTGPFTLTNREFIRAVSISIDAGVTTPDVTIPNVKKMFILDNRAHAEVCVLTKGATTYNVPAGVALPFYSGSGVDDLSVLTSYEVEPIEFTVTAFKSLAPTADEVIGLTVMNRDVDFPQNLTDSQAYAGLTATANATIDIRKNGSSIGTVNFASGSNTGTFTFATAQSFASGDVLAFVAQNPADLTLGDISLTLKGTIQ